MKIKWEYNIDLKLWELYIDGAYMAAFDQYDYEKQRAIFRVLQVN